MTADRPTVDRPADQPASGARAGDREADDRRAGAARSGLSPLVLEFEVGVPAAQAFETWTLRCATWWPPGHTVSGDPSAITFEPRVGGRIFECGGAGVEHEWGTVLGWEPPNRLRYSWHLFFDPSEATEVTVAFTPHHGGTTVRLEQSGWERLAEGGPPRRQRTRAVWGRLAPLFAQACVA